MIESGVIRFGIVAPERKLPPLVCDSTPAALIALSTHLRLRMIPAFPPQPVFALGGLM